MTKKMVLGRGLGALISDGSEFEQPRMENTNEIDIGLIDINPDQPRKHFDQEALDELSASIKQLGIIQPITVRKTTDGRFQIISGERRFRASKMAGLTKIPAFIRTADDQNMLEMALVENIQREDLDAIEIAISYQRLIEEVKLTQEALSERIGKKRATIANYLRLLNLPAQIQLGIRGRKIGMGHARALVAVEDAEKQLEIFQYAMEEGLSVRQVEELVKDINSPAEEIEAFIPKEELAKPTEQLQKAKVSDEYSGLQRNLSQYFQSKVELKRNPKGDGKIIIQFKSDEDFERIIGVFDKLKD